MKQNVTAVPQMNLFTLVTDKNVCIYFYCDKLSAQRRRTRKKNQELIRGDCIFWLKKGEFLS